MSASATPPGTTELDTEALTTMVVTRLKELAGNRSKDPHNEGLTITQIVGHLTITLGAVEYLNEKERLDIFNALFEREGIRPRIRYADVRPAGVPQIELRFRFIPPQPKPDAHALPEKRGLPFVGLGRGVVG